MRRIINWLGSLWAEAPEVEKAKSAAAEASKRASEEAEKRRLAEETNMPATAISSTTSESRHPFDVKLKRLYESRLSELKMAIRTQELHAALAKVKRTSEARSIEGPVPTAPSHENSDTNDQIQECFDRAIVWYDKKEYDKVISELDEVIRRDPNLACAFLNRGAAWYGKKLYDEAIQDFNEAVRLDPKNPFGYNNRGISWSAKEEYDKAIQDYNEAIRIDPWSGKGEYEKAVEAYNEAIRLDPKNPLALIKKSKLLRRLARIHESAKFSRHQRVAIVDPIDGTREPLRDLLLGVESVWLEAECSSYDSFIDELRRSVPDLVLVALDAEGAIASYRELPTKTGL